MFVCSCMKSKTMPHAFPARFSGNVTSLRSQNTPPDLTPRASLQVVGNDKRRASRGRRNRTSPNRRPGPCFPAGERCCEFPRLRARGQRWASDASRRGHQCHACGGLFANFGNRVEPLAANPTFDRRAADGRMHEPDRDVRLTPQRPREEITHGRALPRCLGRTDLPAAGDFVRRLERARRRDREEANQRFVGSRRFTLAVARSQYRHAHIRLAGTEPDFAGQHIVDRECVAASDR